MLDRPFHKVFFLGDFNAHHMEWLSHSSGTDRAGVALQEMCDIFNLQQLVDLPTRGDNTLDLVLSPFDGVAVARAHPGTSDHVSVAFELQVLSPPQAAPDAEPVRDWEYAPWIHIKGALRRYLKDWDPRAFASPSLAQSNLSEWISEIIDRYVPLAEPSAKSEAPWWNYHCDKAYKYKQRVFLAAGADSLEYKRAVDWNKIVQRRASRLLIGS